MQRRRSAYSVAAVAALAMATPLLTACGGEPRAGSAAVVDGERITVSQVQARAEAVRAAQRADEQSEELIRSTGPLAEFSLNQMINQRVVERAAEDLDVSVSRREVQERRAADEKAVGGAAQLRDIMLKRNAIAPDQIDERYRTGLLLDKIAEALGAQPGTPEAGEVVVPKLTETSKAMAIEVNPRFGAWDDEHWRLVVADRDWLKTSPGDGTPDDGAPGGGHDGDDGHDGHDGHDH
ncbi:SurA N-terminal domain-containing protein [Streptomyces durbertensis]|uniref:SurA N-terminal domain-containing protein n=1 Tax=Streptomyces durbertensis TaxID=2448886 RepID=A0ABR6ELH6_9ACTN|nr:SurA N-terminal domain-containing protein [Streptomyces durbertensis]MBB1245998.1 SurA N-terminal domain-containing protein [Streptomyces durbertensis]